MHNIQNNQIFQLINIHEEVEGYEFRGDGDYTPNDQEKALLEDFGNGLIGRICRRDW